MDYDGRSTIAVERVGTITEIYVLVGKIHFRLAVGAHHEVGHISGVVSLGIVEAVLLSVGIKMRAC